MTTLRFIGDVHGRYADYLRLLDGPDYTFQVGDLSMNYRPFASADPIRHRAIGGNHELYEPGPGSYWDHPQFLGNYGLHAIPGFPPIFYLRGAWSIDGQMRRDHEKRGGPKSWWPEEECDEETLERAEQLYSESKPAIVVSHECPMDLVRHVTNPEFARMFGHPPGTIPTRTNQALQRMLDIHQPRLWVFAHYHRREDFTIDGTRFVCLDMIRPGNANQVDAILDLASNDFRDR